MLAEYTLSIDPEFAENGEELGIFEIANTANPAIMLKGVAFSSQNNKSIFFADNKKYRIAAPVLIPGKIYRKDEETGEEYYAKVTTEYIESVFVDFMAKRMGGQVFNEEHDETVKPPSYILETWMVQDSETDKSKTVYGLEVPNGSWFAVQQFTDKEVYNDYVERGLTGFSIHGHSAMLLMSAQNKTEMEKEETKKVEAMDATLEEGSKFMIGDKYYEVKDGVPVEVIEEEVEMTDGEKTEVVVEEEKTELAYDKKEEEVVEMTDGTEEADKEKEAELTEDKKEETKMAEEIPVDCYSKEEVDAKFNEVFDMLAEIKKEHEQIGQIEEVADEASIQMTEAPKSRAQIMRSKLDKFGKFSPKQK